MDSKTLQALGVVLNQNILDTYKQSKRNELFEREANMNMHTSAYINAAKYELKYYSSNRGYRGDIMLFPGYEPEDSDVEDDDSPGVTVPPWFDYTKVELDIFIQYFTNRGYCVISGYRDPLPGQKERGEVVELVISPHPMETPYGNCFNKEGKIIDQRFEDSNKYYPVQNTLPLILD